MMPGIGNQLKGLEIDERELARVEAIILSMTPRERGFPHTIDGSRRQRIARGSGTTVQEVSRLLNARKEMQKLMKQMGKGKMPALPGTGREALRKEQDGSTDEIDPRRIEEEPDLPGRGRGLALAARREVHRDRRPLQPAGGPLADRVRRGRR